MLRVALIVSLLLPVGAGASIFDTYGFGARGKAMGNAMTAAAYDYHAIYYNPAQLMERLEIHVGFGLSYIEPQLGFLRGNENSALTSLVPERNLGYHMGISTPLGGVFKNKLAFGAGFFAPVLRVTRAEFTDAGRPNFYMYESLPDKLLIAVAMAGQPFEWWKLGVGIQVLADLDGRAELELSLVDQRVTRRKLSIDLHSDLALTAGMTFTPTKGLNIAVSYRQDLDLEFKLPVSANITDLGQLDFSLSGTSLYTPHQINAGVSWRLPWVPLRIVADMTWAMWSRAPSPVPEVAFTIDANVLTDDPGHAPIIDVAQAPVSLQTVDVIIGRIGMEYTLGDLDLRAGYFFRPTPIPNQVADTNFVDSDAHVATLGAGWGMRDGAKRPLSISVAFQATVLRPRRVDKDDPDDATGSYTAQGAVYSVGLDIQHDF